VSVVFFDVGETLVDETRAWERHADRLGVPRFTLMGIVGGLAARGESHRRAWELLGVEPTEPLSPGHSDLYPDALECLGTLRGQGYRLGASGNMPESFERLLSAHVDVTGSSQRWGVHKPDGAFFERLAEEAGEPPERIAYVGDRVDNDVVPARRAGMLAVHVRRGPWGYLQDASEADVRIDSLTELPEVLHRLDGADG
jgi:HAD superfamily hydrolase (TIGR01549 family)